MDDFSIGLRHVGRVVSFGKDRGVRVRMQRECVKRVGW